jgi:hypothetical protein
MQVTKECCVDLFEGAMRKEDIGYQSQHDVFVY